MRLHAEEDQNPFGNFGYTIARRNARDNVLGYFNQTKAGLDDPRKMGASCEDAPTLPHMGKFGCQRAADRASTDYAYFHEGIPFHRHRHIGHV
jgi:hypothetical protein